MQGGGGTGNAGPTTGSTPGGCGSTDGELAVALANELARRQGISKTAAIHQALSERLRRLGFADAAQERLLAELRAIRERLARLPELDNRTDEEIIGYDEHGIPN